MKIIPDLVSAKKFPDAICMGAVKPNDKFEQSLRTIVLEVSGWIADSRADRASHGTKEFFQVSKMSIYKIRSWPELLPVCFLVSNAIASSSTSCKNRVTPKKCLTVKWKYLICKYPIMNTRLAWRVCGASALRSTNLAAGACGRRIDPCHQLP